MKSVEWLVLDVDDTLYLERHFVASGFAAVSIAAHDELALNDFGTLCQSVFNEGRRGDVFDEALRRCGVDATPEVVSTLVDAYREHTPSINLCADAMHLLTQRPRGLGVVVLTGGDPRVQQRKVDVLGLVKLTDHIVLSGARGPDHDKPHSWSFEYVQELTGARASQILYVGDNPAKDLPAASDLGWSFVRIRRPLSLHENVNTPDGVTEVSNLDAVVTMLTHSN